MSTLDDILSDEPFEQAEESTVEQVEEPAQPRDETGKFAPKGETESASPAPVEQRQPDLEHPALIAERRRRQEAEARLAAFEAAAIAEPPPSIFEDEQGWQNNFGNNVVSQAVQEATLNARVEMSEMLARQAHPDFEDMKNTFLSLMDQNPSLKQQCQADPHPWNKAYQIAKSHKMMQELGATDVATLEARLTEKIRAELTQQAQAQAPVSQQFPASLAGAQSGRSTGSAVQPPPSLNDILRG